MKTLLRVTLLAAALMVAVLTTAGIATTDGTCYTTCYADNLSTTTPGIVYVQWRTTQADCCGGVVIPPCPTGYHAGYSSYQPYLGQRAICPPVYN